MGISPTLVTADRLLAMHDPGWRLELISGVVRRLPFNGHEHGEIAMRVGWRLAQFVEHNKLGDVYAAGTGFVLRRDPDTVRAPDIAFVTKSRLPAQESTGFFPGAPDIAVEVVALDDDKEAVESKVLDWLDAGARIVLVVNSVRAEVSIYRSQTDVSVLTCEQQLELPDLMPGWSISVAEIFAEE